MLSKWKKFLPIFSAFLVLLLTGCASGASNSDSGDQGASADGSESVELDIWMWDNVQRGGVQAAIDAYTDQNPNVEVKLQVIPKKSDYLTKLDASLEAGDAPDVMWQSYEAGQYVDKGVLEPLNSYIESSDVNLDDYNSVIADLYNFDGEQYGIPKDMDAHFVVINKEIFEENNIDLPSEDWTFDEMVEIANQLKENMPANSYPLYFNTVVRNGIGSLVEMQGGSLVEGETKAENTNFKENGTGETTLEMLKGLVDDELIPHPVNNPDFEATSSLISNNVAMATIPSWEIPAISQSAEPGKFVAVPYPAVDGNSNVDTNGLAYVINANSENKEAAWDLIQFLTSDEGAKIHADNGAALPANNAVQDSWAETNSNIENMQVVDKITENVFLRVTSGYPEVNRAVNEFSSGALMEFFLGEMNAEEAVQEFDNLLQEDIRNAQ